MTTELTTVEKILLALDELIEIHGTEHLSYEICHNSKPWVLAKVRQLRDQGHCQIIHGNGRGHKTLYRRNRNSPGAPRKVTS